MPMLRQANLDLQFNLIPMVADAFDELRHEGSGRRGERIVQLTSAVDLADVGRAPSLIADQAFQSGSRFNAPC